ncbi:hypothetical protein FZC76_10225 [Sutcliffiella horikoshii]|uniref:Uncharacterized protein n=1 Tax=Sutcliffiella horikoshii TaxID=79883 RepID=A0A5D4T0I9_9BACI|nr:hypothetical protein [Sutcliffiella horikoshii]TYS68118.1 hypothetical protein FZC76_10225 [Sutcliffiella horikoshii]
MELKMEYYVLLLIMVSFVFFYAVVPLFGGTNEAYRDYLLTIALIHFVMLKLITIKKGEE